MISCHCRLPVLLIMFLFLSCGKKEKPVEEVLLRYGDKILSYEEVETLIPKGISNQDSVSLFHSIVDGWIKEVVLSDFAEQQLYDLNSIERKVRNYRNNLIVQEYLIRMQETRKPKIDENKVKDYYELHKNEIKLEVPLVKGLFLKFSNSMGELDDLRKLLLSQDPGNIDKLEQEWLDKSLEYNYFQDKWIDWETISGMIPYRFGNADDFLNENNYFEIEYGDCVFFLQINDYILSGNIQPYEYAKEWITNVLTQGALADYEYSLVNSLMEEAVKDHKLELVGYDPFKHEIIPNKNE